MDLARGTGLPTDEIWKRVEDSLKSVGMISYRHHSPNKLSGGQKQRVSNCRGHRYGAGMHRS